MSCAPIGDTDSLGQYLSYSDKIPACAATYMGRPRFFGRNVSNNKPLFVALDFEHYQIARGGMAIATSATIILGVALIYISMKKKKSL